MHATGRTETCQGKSVHRFIARSALGRFLAQRVRSVFRNRNKTYELRDSEIHLLSEVGKFRVVAQNDLAEFAYNGDRSRMERDIENLERQGLAEVKAILGWSSPAEASPEPMRSVPGASAKSGCFGSRNSPTPSYGMRPRFQNRRNRVRSALAVPAEKRIMANQRGSLKKVPRKEGETWVLRFRVTNAEGKRVEHNAPIGLVRDFPKDDDAWREVDRRGLRVRINDTSSSVSVSFGFLAEHYLKADFGEDAVRPKSANTIPIVEHYVRGYLIERFGEDIAGDIKPLDIQRWLKSLNQADGLAWTTISKIRGIMLRIYKIGIRHELVTKNPVQHVETRSKSDYRAIIITPGQTLAILKSLPSPLHFALVLTCAATALRASEILALRWSDILWGEGRIRISKRWAEGKTGKRRRMHRTATFHCIRL
jgi:hypothetical protein